MKNEIDNVKFVCRVSQICILATFPEWVGGGKHHQNDKMGAKSAATYNKQRVQGKNPLLEQHLDGDISNAFHAGCFELGIENVLLIITEIKY